MMLGQPLKLEKSKRWFANHLAGLGDLNKTSSPIKLKTDSIQEDAQWIAQQFNGRIHGKDGREFILVTDSHPRLENLILLEFIDVQTARGVGFFSILLLPQIREISMGHFNLKGARFQGIGKHFTRVLSSFIPKGALISFRIEEFYTKGVLYFITSKLMEYGQISDWRLSSPLRPKPKKGENLFLPAEDQKKIEMQFLAGYAKKKSPILKLLD
jgi:hypothetical protein